MAQAVPVIEGTGATLDGHELLGAFGPIGWTLRSGTQPSQRVFIVDPDTATALLKDPRKQMDLVITPANGLPSITIRRLYVIGTAPAPDPMHTAIVVSDRRFLWSRVRVRRHYNVRRRTGDTRLISGNLQPGAVFAPNIAYAVRTTKDMVRGTAWTAAEILKDVILAVDNSAIVADDTQLQGRTSLRTEDVFIDDQGDHAIARALGLVPGTDIFIDKDDNVIYYDVTDGRTGDVFKALGDPVRGGGVAALVDVPEWRPAYVDVLFERLIEVRLNFHDPTPSAGTVDSFNQASSYQLENVLPCPDVQLTMPDGRIVGMGTWITFDDFFGAMAKIPNSQYPPLLQKNGAKLTKAWLTRAWARGTSELMFGLSSLANDPVWQRRLDAAFAHYRQTFRVVRPIADTFLTLEPRRIDLLDSVTGSPALAQVFASYAKRTDIRSMFYNTGAPGLPFLQNINGYNINLGGMTPAPLRVSMLDTVAMVFRVTPELLPNASGFGAAVFPCQFARTNVNADPSAPGDLFLQAVPLSNTHDLAVIMCATPLTPNDKRQLHRVRVLPADAQPFLTQPIGQASGPGLEIRVPGTTIAARTPWVDALQPTFDQLFGLDNAHQDDFIDAPIVNADDVEAVAFAAAACAWMPYLAHYEGAQASIIAPGVTIAGFVTSVEHRLEPDGKVHTVVVARPPVAGIDPLSELPDSVRQITNKLTKLQV